MKISSRSHGQGPLVVFLHGYAGSVLHWDPVISNMKSQFTCVVVNYAHFYMGRSSVSFSNQVNLLSEWISAYLKDKPDSKVHLVGMSYGAALAWGIGLRCPQLVDKVVFINPMPPSPAKHFSLFGMKLFFRLPLSRALAVGFLSTFFGRNFLKQCAQIFRMQSPEDTHRLNSLTGKKKIFVAHLFNNFAWILKHEDWKHWELALKKWKHSSHLIFDDQDPLFKKPCYSDFYDLLRCDEKTVLSGAGHIAIQGLPQMISKLVSDYLSKDKYDVQSKQRGKSDKRAS